MEPRREEREERKDREPRAEANEAKPRRFRIVKLEERIAPGGGNNGGTQSFHSNCYHGGGTCNHCL
jgi:hypothetical protein